MNGKIYFAYWINFIFRCILPQNVVKWLVNILCFYIFQLKLKILFSKTVKQWFDDFYHGVWQHPFENCTNFLCQVDSGHAMYLLYNDQE